MAAAGSSVTTGVNSDFLAPSFLKRVPQQVAVGPEELSLKGFQLGVQIEGGKPPVKDPIAQTFGNLKARSAASKVSPEATRVATAVTTAASRALKASGPALTHG